MTKLMDEAGVTEMIADTAPASGEVRSEMSEDARAEEVVTRLNRAAEMINSQSAELRQATARLERATAGSPPPRERPTVESATLSTAVADRLTGWQAGTPPQPLTRTETTGASTTGPEVMSAEEQPALGDDRTFWTYVANLEEAYQNQHERMAQQNALIERLTERLESQTARLEALTEVNERLRTAHAALKRQLKEGIAQTERLEGHGRSLREWAEQLSEQLSEVEIRESD